MNAFLLGLVSALRTLFATRTAIASGVIFVAICLAALMAPWIAPYGMAEQNLLERLEPPSASHWMGTDNFGRDIFSRVLWGTRISLLVGIGATIVGLIVGGAVGIWAGYKGGRWDMFLSRVLDVLMSFPALILCLLIVAMIGPGVPQLISAIAVSLIPKFARVARSSALAIGHREFIDACRTMGASDARIVVRHILPNVGGELVVMASLWTAHAILIEASLSFLGLGVSPPTPTLGGMMLEGLNLLHEAPWLTLMPGLAILLAVLVLNVIGDSLRDAVDPRLSAA